MKNIIFDFDGTIANTEALAYQIYQQVGQENDFNVLPKDEFDALKQVSIYEKFKRHQVSIFKLPKLARKAMRVLNQMMDEVEAYPGIIALLHTLKKEGYQLFIVSSNSKKNILHFLKRHGLDMFTDIYGKARYFGKEKVLRKLMKKHHVDKDSIIYIGDEVRDVVSCKNMGIAILSVSWGFDDPKFLKEDNPGCVIDNIEQLKDRLLKKHD